MKRKAEEASSGNEPPRKRPRRKKKTPPLPVAMKSIFSRNAKPIIKKCARTLQMLNSTEENSKVFSIQKFLTDKETSHILKLAKSMDFKKSFTEDDTDELKKVIDETRTSEFVFFKRGQDDIIRRIERRAADILGLTSLHVEPLQVVYYTKGAQFQIHHDIGTYFEDTGKVSIVEPKRLATFFVYLNTMPEGIGHTEFPKCDLSLRPEAGKAALWLNVKVEDPSEADFNTIHVAKSVPGGYEKYGMNIWVTEKPC